MILWSHVSALTLNIPSLDGRRSSISSNNTRSPTSNVYARVASHRYPIHLGVCSVVQRQCRPRCSPFLEPDIGGVLVTYCPIARLSLTRQHVKYYGRSYIPRSTAAREKSYYERGNIPSICVDWMILNPIRLVVS